MTRLLLFTADFVIRYSTFLLAAPPVDRGKNNFLVGRLAACGHEDQNTKVVFLSFLGE
jgi:hypothetical protein